MFLDDSKKIVLVFGPRNFNDKETFYNFFRSRLDKINFFILGGAKSINELLIKFSEENNVPYLTIPTSYHNEETGIFDKSARFIYLRHIINYSDICIIFSDNKSKGTLHVIEIAKQLNKPIQIVKFTPKEEVEKIDAADL